MNNHPYDFIQSLLIENHRLFSLTHCWLMTWDHIHQLLKNAQEAESALIKRCSHHPVIKLFTPDDKGTWLLTELSLHDPEMAYGLCDMGDGFPSLDFVSITGLFMRRGPLDYPVVRERDFIPTKTLKEYAEESFEVRRVVA